MSAEQFTLKELVPGRRMGSLGDIDALLDRAITEVLCGVAANTLSVTERWAHRAVAAGKMCGTVPLNAVLETTASSSSAIS